MKIKLIAVLTLLVAWASFGETKQVKADPLPNSQIPVHLWYVKRSATHISSGYTYTQEYGPYNTQAQAEAKKAELDQNLAFGTYGYGIAQVYSKVNPLLLNVQQLQYKRRKSAIQSAPLNGFQRRP